MGELEISDDPSRLDRELIFEYLTQRSYWARDRSRESFDRSLQHSLVFGVYRDARQVAFARVVTDRATFAYLCDVFVIESERGRAIGKSLIAAVVAHPDLQGLRRFHLATRDAHGLYEQFGFRALRSPENHMERRDSD